MKNCFILLALCLTLQACGPLRVHTYLIAADTEPGWVTIEYGNPRCPALVDGIFGREFLIPKSRYLCTSSQRYEGLHRAKYYLIDSNNNRTSLNESERIFKPESFFWKEGSLEQGLPDCNVTGDEFFYGPKDKLTYDNPIRKDPEFLKLHSDCHR
jgi:hypothetical protein